MWERGADKPQHRRPHDGYGLVVPFSEALPDCAAWKSLGQEGTGQCG